MAAFDSGVPTAVGVFDLVTGPDLLGVPLVKDCKDEECSGTRVLAGCDPFLSDLGQGVFGEPPGRLDRFKDPRIGRSWLFSP